MQNVECRMQNAEWLELPGPSHSHLSRPLESLFRAVAAAYGWPADLTDEQIPEKLLAFNFERAAQEAKAAKVNKPRTSRLNHVDELI